MTLNWLSLQLAQYTAAYYHSIELVITTLCSWLSLLHTAGHHQFNIQLAITILDIWPSPHCTGGCPHYKQLVIMTPWNQLYNIAGHHHFIEPAA